MISSLAILYLLVYWTPYTVIDVKIALTLATFYEPKQDEEIFAIDDLPGRHLSEVQCHRMDGRVDLADELDQRDTVWPA
ncbi:MAG: hypothetical protein PHZ02_07375 [Desulfocapsaceae bacterium]|nr:hypothetical protein [Desulfocapsaceae bacterium]